MRSAVKSWILVLTAVAFVALGGWMLIDSFVDPAPAEPGQLWMAAAIVVMFGASAVVFAHELISGRRDERHERAGAGHGPASADGTLIATYSGTWVAVALACCVAFAAAGGMMAVGSAYGGADGPGWYGIGVGLLALLAFGAFGLLAATQLWRAGWPNRRIRIGNDGIDDSRVGRLIRWTDIRWIGRRTIQGQRLIELDLINPDFLAAHLGLAERGLARLNQAFGFGFYAIALTGLSAREDEVLAAIKRFKPPQVPVVDLAGA